MAAILQEAAKAAKEAKAKSKKKAAVDEHHDHECVVCMERHIEVMLLPCKCYKLCVACSDDIKSRNGDCPWCRAKVDKHMRVRKA